MEWSYRRWSHRGVEIYSLAAWLSPTLLAFMTMACMSRYFDLSSGDHWRALGIFELGIAVACGWAMIVMVRRRRSDVRWLRSHPRPEPPHELWEVAIRLPRDATIAYGWRNAAIAAPAGAIAVAAAADLSFAATLVVFVGLLITVLFLVLLCLFGTEVWARPIARDVTARLPRATDPPPAGLSVESKLFLGVLALVLVSGFFVGSLVVERGSGADSLASVIGVSFAISLTLSLVITAFYGEVVMGPIRRPSGGDEGCSRRGSQRHGSRAQ